MTSGNGQKGCSRQIQPGIPQRTHTHTHTPTFLLPQSRSYVLLLHLTSPLPSAPFSNSPWAYSVLHMPTNAGGFLPFQFISHLTFLPRPSLSDAQPEGLNPQLFSGVIPSHYNKYVAVSVDRHQTVTLSWEHLPFDCASWFSLPQSHLLFPLFFKLAYKILGERATYCIITCNRGMLLGWGFSFWGCSQFGLIFRGRERVLDFKPLQKGIIFIFACKKVQT